MNSALQEPEGGRTRIEITVKSSSGNPWNGCSVHIGSRALGHIPQNGKIAIHPNGSPLRLNGIDVSRQLRETQNRTAIILQYDMQTGDFRLRED